MLSKFLAHEAQVAFIPRLCPLVSGGAAPGNTQEITPEPRRRERITQFLDSEEPRARWVTQDRAHHKELKLL